MTSRAVFLHAFLVFCGSCMAAAADPKPQTSLAPVLQPLLDKHAMVGAVMLVADKDRVLHLEAMGDADPGKRPMQTDSLFWIASMTKSITGTALMLLVDEGKVNIDDPVEKYLPEFKGQQVLDETGKAPLHAPKHPITVREIMSHTSGLVKANDPALKQRDTLKEMVEQYSTRPLIREPGTKYEYNNTGINTAGRIIEVVSGLSYADFVQQRLFTPLGMKDSSFWPDETLASRLARTVRLNAEKTALETLHFGKDVTPALAEKLGKGVKVSPLLLDDYGISRFHVHGNHYAEPAGGLFSTASDVGRFCQMLLNGGVYEGKRYLSEKAIHQMTTSQTNGVPVNPGETYGLGWSVKIKDDEGPSVGSFGHRGARKTVMWVDPSNGLVIVLLVQLWEVSPENQKQLYNAFFKAAIAQYGKAR